MRLQIFVFPNDDNDDGVYGFYCTDANIRTAALATAVLARFLDAISNAHDHNTPPAEATIVGMPVP